MHCNATHTRHNSHTARAATAGSALTATPEGTQPHTELGTDREDEHFRHSNLHSVQLDVTHVPGLRPLCRCITTPQYHSSGFGSQGGGSGRVPQHTRSGGGGTVATFGAEHGFVGRGRGVVGLRRRWGRRGLVPDQRLAATTVKKNRKPFLLRCALLLLHCIKVQLAVMATRDRDAKKPHRTSNLALEEELLDGKQPNPEANKHPVPLLPIEAKKWR